MRAHVHSNRSALLAARARLMRFAPTPSEQRLWAAIRGGQLGVLFRRQVPIAGYIADFASLAARLVVEVDGGCHARSAGLTRAEMRRYAAPGITSSAFPRGSCTRTSLLPSRVLLPRSRAGDGRSCPVLSIFELSDSRRAQGELPSFATGGRTCARASRAATYRWSKVVHDIHVLRISRNRVSKGASAEDGKAFRPSSIAFTSSPSPSRGWPWTKQYLAYAPT
jgi:hypothetical protein